MHSHYGVETNNTLLFIRHSVAFHRISIRLNGPNDTIALGDGLGQNDGAQAASGFHGKSSCLYERTYPILFSMFFLLRRIVSYLWESVKVPFRPVRSDVETVQSLQIDSLRVYPS